MFRLNLYEAELICCAQLLKLKIFLKTETSTG